MIDIIAFEQDIRYELSSFIKSDPRQKWIEVMPMKLYVRKAQHYFEGHFVNCLDIANVSIANETKRGNGLFTVVCDIAEELAKKHSLTIYHENVMPIQLRDFHLRRGYKEHTIENCYYKSFNL